MNNEDMSNVFDKLNSFTGQNNISPDMINNLMNMINSSNNNQDSSGNTSSEQHSNYSNNNNSSFDSSGIDFETIMRMKSIIDKMNVKDDPRSNLLQSLKPYLNDSRKSKVDQYIQLMNMSKAMDIFSSMGGDQNKNG